MPMDREAEIADLLQRARTAESDAGLELAGRAVTLSREGGSPGSLANALTVLGTIRETAGDLVGAETPFLEARAVRREAFGEASMEAAVSAEDLAVLHYRKSDYAGAVPFFQEALAIRRRLSPDGDASVARLLNNLAMMFDMMGSFAEGEPLLEEALAIRRRVLGDDDFETTATMLNLAGLLRQRADHAGAEARIQEALSIRRRTLGEDHVEVAHCLNDLADLYADMSRFAEAEPLFARSLDIVCAALGEDDVAVAVALDNLASIQMARGDYAAAGPRIRRAHEILHARGSKLDEANSLHQLGYWATQTGDLAEAKRALLGALELKRSLLGDDHPDVAITIDVLATVHHALGEYDEADARYREALRIRRARLGGDHPAVAVTLQSLACLHRDMGDFEAALPLFQQALDMQRRCFGDVHVEVAVILDNLAELHLLQRDYTAAEGAFQEAMRIHRALFGEESRAYAMSLDGLAQVRAAAGERESVRPLYEEALALRKKALGDDDPDVAASLLSIAFFEAMSSRFDAAEARFREAIAGIHRTLGEDHLLHYRARRGLAILQVQAERDADARAAMESLFPEEDRLVERVFAVASERQRNAYLASIADTLDFLLTLVRRALRSTPEMARLALDYVLRRKAMQTDALATQRDLILGGRHPELAGELQEIAALRAQIAQRSLTGPGPDGLEEHARTLAAWRERAERIESDLAGRIPEMNRDGVLRTATRAAVAAALPEGSVLIEIVRYREWVAHPPEGADDPYPRRYLALVLRAGDPDGVRAVDLGMAGEIDDLATRFRASLGAPDGADRRLLPVPDMAADPPAGARLRAAVLAPIEALLGEARHLFIAPDGELSCIPFEVLPSADGRLLIDEYAVSYVGVGRDILRFGARSTVPAEPPLVIADPDFALAAPAETTAPDPATDAAPKARSRAHGRGALSFERLPGTRVEGMEIAARLGVAPWLGDDALEGRLKGHRSPRVLHIATHGFFFAPADRPPAPPEDMLDRLIAAGREDPLLCSGVALAGASTWFAGGTPPREAEDGVLNGRDVSALDLCATELAVLSACDTGLGEIRVGDGVHGLRRAFIVAGVRTLVMSLWKVPDVETQRLMVGFYERVLAGMPCAEALREARLALRKERPDPYFWGAFICHGDPGPLGAAPK
ncbi:kinesin light chain-like protein [Minicystis rosea]|nr:kinesin light chain-like protein [Minicystis rosea]